MNNLIYKNNTLNYNNNILFVNNYLIEEKDNPYGHTKSFIKLNKGIKYDAHRVISKEVLLLLLDNFEIGSVTDINGNTYYFDVFKDGIYRVFRVNKYESKIKEIIENEKYTNKNS